MDQHRTNQRRFRGIRVKTRCPQLVLLLCWCSIVVLFYITINYLWLKSEFNKKQSHYDISFWKYDRSLIDTFEMDNLFFDMDSKPDRLVYDTAMATNYFSSAIVNYTSGHRAASNGTVLRGAKNAISETFNSNVLLADLLTQNPPKFLPNLQNPCWFHPHQRTHKKLHCLPFFFIAGFPKCGTTDLFMRLILHPGIVHGCRKEPHFWTRVGFSKTFRWYLDCMSGISSLQTAVLRRHKSGLREDNNDVLRNFVAVDASASTLWDNNRWRHIRENAVSNDTPTVLVPDLVRHVLPRAKFLVIVRNPVDRLYSDYNYFANLAPVSPEHFHQLAVAGTSAVSHCTARHRITRCILDDRVRAVADQRGLVKGTYRFTLTVGFYAVHIENWLQVFPKHQFLFIRLEDEDKYSVDGLENIFTFLNITLPSNTVLLRMSRRRTLNVQRKASKMLNKTRSLLEVFYRPYNENLARLLGDERFLFQ